MRILSLVEQTEVFAMTDKKQATKDTMPASSRSDLAKHALAAGMTVVPFESDEEDPIDLQQLRE